jgi:hypothetical protein
MSNLWTSDFWTFLFDSLMDASETARETDFGTISIRVDG